MFPGPEDSRNYSSQGSGCGQGQSQHVEISFHLEAEASLKIPDFSYFDFFQQSLSNTEICSNFIIIIYFRGVKVNVQLLELHWIDDFFFYLFGHYC